MSHVYVTSWVKRVFTIPRDDFCQEIMKEVYDGILEGPPTLKAMGNFNKYESPFILVSFLE